MFECSHIREGDVIVLKGIRDRQSFYTLANQLHESTAHRKRGPITVIGIAEGSDIAVMTEVQMRAAGWIHQATE
jgi:hypothetical protein